MNQLGYILEAHPSHADLNNAGLYVLGNEQQINNTYNALLYGTLGALAVETPGVTHKLAQFALHNLSYASSQHNYKIPSDLVPGVTEVLGENLNEHVKVELDRLVESAVAGHITPSSLIETSKIVQNIRESGGPHWLTHEGLHANVIGGNLTANIKSLNIDRPPIELEPYQLPFAEEVDADAFVFQMRVIGNVPGSRRVALKSPEELIALGKLSPDGGFNHIVTLLNEPNEQAE